MNCSLKILQLPGYCYPEEVSSSHMAVDLQEAFDAADFVTENFAPTPTRGVTEEDKKKFKKIKYEELNDGKVIIHRFFMFQEGKNPILRAFRYLLVNLIQFQKGSKAKDIELIYSASTPPTQGLLNGFVKKKLSKRYGHNVPFVYNLQDIFPDSLVNAKMTSKGSIIWKIGRKIEDFTYRNADKIIVINNDFKQNIIDKGVPKDKIIVIPNWVNTNNVYYIDRKNNPLFEKYSLDRSLFYICYSGNIGLSQDLELVIETAKTISPLFPDIRFVFIGEGAELDNFKKRISEENITNIILLPFQPYEDIAQVFSLGDVGLIISKKGIGGSSVPSKTWSIMAAGRPILASFDIDSELSKLVQSVSCGVVSEPGNVDSLVSAIKQLREADRTDLGNRGKNYLDTYLNKDKSVRLYVETFLKAVNKFE